MLGFVFLLAPQFFYPFDAPSVPEKFLQKQNVRGMAVKHNGLLYTVNFKQQNQLIDWFNSSQRLTKTGHEKTQTDIEKIIIYQFNAPDIEVEPIVFENNVLIYSSPNWYSDGFLRETSAGSMKTLLSQTYDP